MCRLVSQLFGTLILKLSMFTSILKTLTSENQIIRDAGLFNSKLQTKNYIENGRD